MITKIMNFIRGIKSVQVSMFDKAKMAVQGVEGALAVFSNLMAELQSANENLQVVANEAKAVIDEHSALREEVVATMYEYTNLIDKVEKLIGGTK